MKPWHDPVWSKVISAGIIGAVILLGTSISNRYDWLQESVGINRFTFIAMLIVLVPANILWLNKLLRAIRT